MKIIQKFKLAISSLLVMLMVLSPLGYIHAEETVQAPQQTAPVVTTEPTSPALPARGVDDTNLGPQQTTTDNQTTPVSPTITPETDSTLPGSAELVAPDVTQPEQAPATNTGNENTGTNSENNASNESNHENTTTIDNEASVVNDIRGIVGTAGNVAMGQRGNIQITTGDASSALSILNMINSIFAGLGDKIEFVYKDVNGDMNQNYIIDPLSGNLTTLDGGQVVINDNTGRNSENVANSDEENTTTNRNSNLSNLINNITLSGNTGDNTILNKVGDNLIKTGNVDLSLNLLNFLNSTFVVSDFGVVAILNILGDWNGDFLLPKSFFDGASAPVVNAGNNTTGENSSNEANLSSSNTDNIDTNNQAEVINDINLTGNTGDNTINKKVGDANILTGGVNLLLNSQTFANITVVGDMIYMAFVNVLGKWSGSDLIGKLFGFTNPAPTTTTVGNSNTGVNSSNDATSSSSNTSDSTTQNQGFIKNIINIFGNTGNNQITGERGDSTIQTGDVNAMANIINFLNANIVGKKLVMLFVNVFGDWNGNIDFEKENSNEMQASPIIVANPSSSETNSSSGNTKKNAVFGNIGFNKPIFAAPLAAAVDSGVKGIAGSLSKNENVGEFHLPENGTKNVMVDYISNHLNLIFFLLFVVYLSFLTVYLKNKKNYIK